MKKFPDTLLIILVIMILFIGLTWILPAGEFDRVLVNGRSQVVPGTFQTVESSPQGIGAFFTAPIKGFIDGAGIIAFVLLVGGAFTMLNHTGAINAGLQSIIRKSKNNKRVRAIIIPVIMILFSLCGATFGMSEEVLVFILITIPLALALGYDSIVGVAIAFVGAGAGFAGAFLNPFTIGIAQAIAEIPQYSGIEYRLVVWAIMTLIAILFVMRYAARIAKNPSKSLVYNSGIELHDDLKNPETIPFTTSRKIIVFLLFIMIGVMMYGVTSLGWYINEITGLFVALGLISVVVARIKPNDAVRAFYSGAKEMVVPAMVIAMAKALIVIASDGKIIDTILNALAGSADGLPAYASVEIMFLFQSALNFFMPSGSGQAALTMPIIAPLSDLLGVGRQTAVLAFQFGDGLSNLIIPTSAVTMGVLGIAKIRYDIWLRWMTPLFLWMSGAAMILLLLPMHFFDWSVPGEDQKNTIASSELTPHPAKGSLIIIGGGSRPIEIVEEIIRLSGLNEEGYGLILPMSSSEPDTAAYYASLQFEDLGIEVSKLITFKLEANVSQSKLDSIAAAKMIYLTGGDQNRFMDAVRGTAIKEYIQKAYKNGATIAGTSAGAALMSEKMLTGNELKHPEYTGEFRTIESENMEISEGLGLLPEAIIDQHFIRRMRMNRLLSVALEHPESLCIGIDESTAILVHENSLKVIGESQVVIIRNPNGSVKAENGLLRGEDLKIDVLLPGDESQILIHDD